jgi:hypothetical protein
MSDFSDEDIDDLIERMRSQVEAERARTIDEIKSIQPWLTMVPLRSNVVLHEHGGPIEQILFSAERHGLAACNHAIW